MKWCDQNSIVSIMLSHPYRPYFRHYYNLSKKVRICLLLLYSEPVLFNAISKSLFREKWYYYCSGLNHNSWQTNSSNTGNEQVIDAIRLDIKKERCSNCDQNYRSYPHSYALLIALPFEVLIAITIGYLKKTQYGYYIIYFLVNAFLCHIIFLFGTTKMKWMFQKSITR